MNKYKSKKIRNILSIVLFLIGIISLIICGIIHLIINCDNLSLVGNPTTLILECPVILMKIMIASEGTLMIGLILYDE